MQTSILDVLRRQFGEYKLSYNMPQRNEVMSSVAMIVRVNPNFKLQKTQVADVDAALELFRSAEVAQKKGGENFYQILFLQRAINPRDSNPGQLCFPGGKCDDNEPDLQAAVRETFEETGIHLDKRMILGKVPRSFYARHRKGKTIFLTTYIFLHLNQSQDIKLNLEEVIDSRWVELTRLIAPGQCLFDFTLPPHPDYLLSIAGEAAKKYGISKQTLDDAFEGACFPAIDLGMSFPLFGLTFYVCIEVVRFILQNCPQFLLPGQLSQAKRLTERAETLRFRFKKDLEQHEAVSQMVVSQYKRLRIVPKFNAPKL